MPTRNEFYETQLYSIRAALESDCERWIEGLGYELATDGLILDTPDAQKLLGRDKGKAAYKGSHSAGRNSKPYLTLTVINHAHGGSRETYDGGKDVVDALWDEYRGSPTSQKIRKANEEKIKAKAIERDASAKNKAKDEASRKAANVKREIAQFGGLSNDPQGSQAKYLIDKKLPVERGTVRYGSDKDGNYTAILLIKADSLGKPARYREPVGVQRFYDRNIKGRNTNKDFTWGFKKSGACHLLGEISKDYAGLLPVCEGYADGVIAHKFGQVPVIVALDSDNVDSVTQAAAEQFPKATVMPICDNDAHKYKQGVDNGGVLKGVEAAAKSGGKYVIPDFTGYDQSGNPKDLWDLWQLGGNEAVDKLLSNPQSPPENWDEFRLNYLGLESFWKEVDRVVRHDRRDPLKAALELARPHLDRLGLDDKAISAHVSQAVSKLAAQKANSFKSYLKRAVDAYKSRLIKADETVRIERDLKGVPCPATGVQVIDSPMASGKSAWLKTNIFDKLLGIILSLLPRVSLHHDQCRRFRTASYETLKDMAKNGKWSKLYELDTRSLTCVYNSLPSVLNILKKKEENELFGQELGKPRLFDEKHDKIDTLVLDEVELGLMHCFFSKFDSETVRHETIRELMRLVREAKSVKCAQAGITEFTRDFFKACGRDIDVTRNEHKRYKGKVRVVVYDRKNDAAMKLLEWVERGEPVTVACSSKKMVQELITALKVKFPHLKIDGIHSGNTGDHLKILLDPSKNTIGLDVFIYSPSVEQGVSIENGRFKHVVGFYEGGNKTVSPSGFAQMLFRSRDVEDIALWCSSQTDDKPTDYLKILEIEATKYKETRRELIKHENGLYSLHCDTMPVITEIDVLKAKAQATLNAERNDPKFTILGILAYMEVKISHVESLGIDDAPAKDLFKLGKQLQAQEYEAGVNAAPKISQDENDQLKSKNATTEADAHKKNKFAMESVLDFDLDALDEAGKVQAHADWKQGRIIKTIKRREIMALPRNQALAIAGHDLEYGRGSWTYLTWKTCGIVSETLGFSFSKTWELGCDGHWRIYDSFRKHPDYPWLVENREAVNSLGLFKIRGNEPTDREIKDMIIATGLPVKFEWVDKDSLTDVISYQLSDVKGDQSGATHSYIKSKSSTPKLDHLQKQKRKLISVFEIDTKATVLNPPKPTDSVERRVFDGITNELETLVEARLLDGGRRIECRQGATFGLDNLRQSNWYEWALANETVFNKANLGARVKNGAISNKGLGALLRRFCFKLVSKRVDVGAKSVERVEIVRGFIEKESDFLRGAIARRLRAGTHLNKVAQKQMDKNAQEIKEYGAPLMPDRPVSPTTARFTVRFWILRSLRIVSDGQGGYRCDPDAVSKLEYVVNDLSDFVNRHKSAINKANLGAQVGADGLTVKILSLWIKAMGIELSSKRIDTHKLLIDKGVENETPSNTGDDPLLNDSKGEVDHPNKTAGVENNVNKNSGLQTQKRELVRVYQVKPKCLQKVREIMDSDKCEYMAEFYETIQNAAESTPIEPQDRPLKQRVEAYLDNHRGEALLLKEVAEIFGVDPNVLLKAAWFIDGIEFPNHDRHNAMIKLPPPFEGMTENPEPDPWNLDEPDGLNPLDDEVPY